VEQASEKTATLPLVTAMLVGQFCFSLFIAKLCVLCLEEAAEFTSCWQEKQKGSKVKVWNFQQINRYSFTK
jgi:hypothetical protein